MPFDKSFDDLYQLGIKAACEEAGAHCERVDEQLFDENILQRVYNQISKADLIVAEMTGRNPNVFYEVGYAHALGKRAILLTRTSEDIPFDLKHYPHLVHQSRIAELKAELFKRVKWAIENPKDSPQFFNQTLECYVNNTKLGSMPVVESEPNVWPYFEISINNSSVRTIQIQDFQFGIIGPSNWDLFHLSPTYRDRDQILTQSFPVSPNRTLHLAETGFQLLPSAWAKLFAVFSASKESADLSEVVIRLLTPSGPIDFPFLSPKGGKQFVHVLPHPDPLPKERE